MEYIAVAEVLNTHGIKGCLKMRPLTDNIERFDEDICYYLGDKKLRSIFKIIECTRVFCILILKNLTILMKFLNSKTVFIYRWKDRYELKDGSFYIDDLIGLKAYSNGEYIGDGWSFERL